MEKERAEAEKLASLVEPALLRSALTKLKTFQGDLNEACRFATPSHLTLEEIRQLALKAGVYDASKTSMQQIQRTLTKQIAALLDLQLPPLESSG